MACYHPLTAIRCEGSFYEKTGKTRIQIMPNNWQKPADMKEENILKLGCGQCIGCRLEYSRQWANRCILEAQEWKENYFITLTYNTENLPIKSTIDTETGELIQKATLEPKHLQKFMKDLRRHFEYYYNHKNIRFYGCGEYGSQGERPHYHIIIFNIPINDLKPYAKNHIGQVRYQSETIEKIWKKGYIDVANVSWESCAYVARYMLKKQKGKSAEEAYRLKEAEFTRMSRKPGIAKNYYEKNQKKIYEFDEIMIAKMDGSVQKIKPPKYYDKLFDIENEEQMNAIKEARKKIAIEKQKSELKKTSLTEQDYLELKEQKHMQSAKMLKRKIEE